MNQFLKKICYFLPLPSFIITINFVVENTHLLQAPSQQAAHLLLADNNLANAFIHGDYFIKEAYAKLSPTKKNILVFGSSRALSISQKLFPYQSFFNMANTGSKLENMVYFYFLWRERGLIPSRVILGLDDWLFTCGKHAFLWPIIQEKLLQVNPAWKIIDKPTVQSYEKKYESLQRLASLTLFRNNLRCIINYLTSKLGKKSWNVFYPTKDKIGQQEIMMTDGSIAYRAEKQNRSAEDIERLIIEDFNKKGIVGLKGPFDNDLVRLFEIFVQLLIHDNVAITFFLSPYHPKAFKLLQVTDLYKTTVKAGECFKKYATINHVALLGGYDPSACNLREEMFYDEFHPKSAVIETIFKGEAKRSDS